MLLLPKCTVLVRRDDLFGDLSAELMGREGKEQSDSKIVLSLEEIGGWTSGTDLGFVVSLRLQ